MKHPDSRVRVVQATMEMLECMYDLEIKVWDKQDSCTRKSLARRIELLPDAIPVAFIDGKIVGYATCARLPLNHRVEEYYQAFYPWDRIHDPHGEILYFYSSTVDPEYRRLGVWRELVKFRVNYAKRNKEIKSLCGGEVKAWQRPSGSGH